MANSKVSLGETVVVEGSLSPAVGYLKRGEKAEVAYSENVADLHRKGFIIVKGKAGEVPPAQGTDQTVPTVPPVSFEKPDQTVPTVPSGNPVTPTVPQGTDQGLVNATPVQAPDQTVPTVPSVKPDQTVPTVPNSGTNQDLEQASPPPPAGNPVTPEVPQGTNQDLVEAAPPEEPKPNPDVDNSLVDVNAKTAQAKTSTTRK